MQAGRVLQTLSCDNNNNKKRTSLEKCVSKTKSSVSAPLWHPSGQHQNATCFLREHSFVEEKRGEFTAEWQCFKLDGEQWHSKKNVPINDMLKMIPILYSTGTAWSNGGRNPPVFISSLIAHSCSVSTRLCRMCCGNVHKLIFVNTQCKDTSLLCNKRTHQELAWAAGNTYRISGSQRQQGVTVVKI